MWYENDTIQGDSWSLCAWTVRHVIRHHVENGRGYRYASLFGDRITKYCLDRRTSVIVSDGGDATNSWHNVYTARPGLWCRSRRGFVNLIYIGIQYKQFHQKELIEIPGLNQKSGFAIN
jgi:hypothetical protein